MAKKHKKRRYPGMQYFKPKPRIKPSDILGKIPAGNRNAQKWGLNDPIEAFFIGILGFLAIGLFAGIATLAVYLMEWLA